jgi:hypothetical protein
LIATIGGWHAKRNENSHINDMVESLISRLILLISRVAKLALNEVFCYCCSGLRGREQFSSIVVTGRKLIGRDCTELQPWQTPLQHLCVFVNEN